KLEKLQALVTIRTSKKTTQQEILSKLITGALEEGDKFVDKAFESTVPMSDEQFKKLLSLSKDWKIKTSWREIDAIVYGPSAEITTPRERSGKKRSQVESR
ncbi:MAG: hypothetical protein ACRECH_15795, partial [Nitrososphaerales archaeon]